MDTSVSDLHHSQGWLQGVKLQQRPVLDHLVDRPSAYDLIHGKDVAEHMTKDEFLRFLQLARASLKPGGQLWLMSFNAQAPLASATRYGDFTHEIGLTPRSLAQCLRACGYDHLQCARRALLFRVAKWSLALAAESARALGCSFDAQAPSRHGHGRGD